ncbi:aspartate aminotransferase family protein [Microbispora sp. GKU 823]|uniref:aspartate aminotransferase family protein n=1 Tax=Microbispora sp. GKU 823 TaxID=1652100 RepID=UPI0009A41FB0|nr:aspartate aminotransferase family protein [Microbispora sp. GKU 823]OPG11472.1 aspartate aminotransferase family protein [Microbispora sp. GKU 823]
MGTRPLLERHRAVMPSWMNLYYEDPIELVRGEGRHVFDSEGRRYLDFFGGLLATMVGHDIPEITEAIREQAGRILHTSTLYLVRRQVELAERIAAASGIPDAKVFFVNSGTEAVETALLLATQYRRSNQVLALRGSYHGRSFGTVAATGIRGWSATSLSPLNVTYVHSGYRLRSPFRGLDDAAYVAACKEELRTIIETATAGDVACLIAEPVQGAGGFATPPPSFFMEMKAVLDEYGILFVSDEVQTGFGRTGAACFGIQAFGVRPDAMAFAKGVANGVAMGGVVARGDLMDCLGANSISTAGGNPLACAAAVATLDVIRDRDLQANADRVGARLREGLERISADHDCVAEVRGMGLMIGVEIVTPGTTRPDPALVARILEKCRSRGLLIGRGGLLGNVLRVTPPMTVTEEEADEALRILADVMDDISARAAV